MMACVTGNGAVSGAFAMTNGMQQDRFLLPILFSLICSVMAIGAYCDGRPGIRIVHRTDGQPLSTPGIKASTRLSTTTAHDLLFTGDFTFNTATATDMQ
ncbi:hypothetical protein SprV_0401707100 [Sparganum proliferum]